MRRTKLKKNYNNKKNYSAQIYPTYSFVNRQQENLTTWCHCLHDSALSRLQEAIALSLESACRLTGPVSLSVCHSHMPAGRPKWSGRGPWPHALERFAVRSHPFLDLTRQLDSQWCATPCTSLSRTYVKTHLRSWLNMKIKNNVVFSSPAIFHQQYLQAWFNLFYMWNAVWYATVFSPYQRRSAKWHRL